MDHYQQHDTPLEDTLVTMMGDLSLGNSHDGDNETNASRSASSSSPPPPLRSCLRQANPTTPAKRKTVDFNQITFSRHYSPEDDTATGPFDEQGELHKLDYQSDFTKKVAIKKLGIKWAMIAQGDVYTCVNNASRNGCLAHLPARTLLAEARRKLLWTQHRAIGNVSRPLSSGMAHRINDASTMTERAIKNWTRDGEIQGARLESCVSVRDKDNLEALIKLFENFVSARDESGDAWERWRGKRDQLRCKFTGSRARC